MAIDGVNSFFQHYGVTLYPPQTVLRLVSGLGAGVALAVLGLPLINSALRVTPRRDQAIVTTWSELWGSIGAVLLIGVLAWQGSPWFFYPLAWLSVMGLISGVLLVNLVAIACLSGLYRRVVLLAQLARPMAISIVLTTGELISLALIRDALARGING